MHPYAPGSWGPAAARRLVGGLRQLARPVGAVMSPAAKQAKATKAAGGTRAARAKAAKDGAKASAMQPAAAKRPQSAAMPSPFPPIADYAFLSDCHTGALVAPDGSDRLAVRPAL